MVVSSRAVVAALATAGALGLGARATAQQTSDSTVRRAGTQGASAGSATAARSTQRPPAPVPAVFGTVDIEKIFKEYNKVKAQQEEFKAAAMAKHAELQKLQAEGAEEASKLQKMTPGSVDAKKIEDRITALKAQLEAGREQAQRDFALRESEMLATLYKEIQDMVARMAQYRGMTYVVQVSNEPVSGSNPNSVMAAMAKTMVYADPRNDITKDVTANLNREYELKGGVVPKATSAAPTSARPAGN